MGRARVRAAPEVRRPGSARHRATPSSGRAVAVGRARHSRRTPAGSPVGTSAAGMAGSAEGGAAEAGAARRLGAGGLRRTPPAGTSSAHTVRGAHGSSRGRRSWQGWPAPAHSPIRPPPSTRRARPATDGGADDTFT